MDFSQLCIGRASVRAYRPEPVPNEILLQVLKAGGMAPSAMTVASDEPAAVELAVEAMTDGDLVVVLAEDVPAVLGQLEPLCPGP